MGGRHVRGREGGRVICICATLLLIGDLTREGNHTWEDGIPRLMGNKGVSSAKGHGIWVMSEKGARKSAALAAISKA
jgi:hypothetical protein